MPLGAFPLSIGSVIIGGLTGLDGSGFSGLPLVGSLSASLATPVGLNVAVLAGLGQAAAIFVGGGCLSAWAFGAVASAGVAGVSATELVRKNFIPVIAGLGVSTVIAIIMLL
jgi:C4-dicarboxylate transporter